MDWKLAIEMNRAALKRVLAALVAMAGLGSAHPSLACRPSPPQGGRLAVATLPRHLHRAVLRVLRPAEAAARRLVIMAARGIVLPPVRPRRHKPKPPPLFLRRGDRGTGIVLPRGFVAPPGFMMPANRPVTVENRPIRSHSFRLLDPLPRFRPRRPRQSGVPRISCPGFTRPFPIVPRLPLTPDDPIDATRIALRLQALERALDDLPGHARRFARWRHRVAAGARKDNRVAAGARREESLVAAGARRRIASPQAREGKNPASPQARERKNPSPQAREIALPLTRGDRASRSAAGSRASGRCAWAGFPAHAAGIAMRFTRFWPTRTAWRCGRWPTRPDRRRRFENLKSRLRRESRREPARGPAAVRAKK